MFCCFVGAGLVARGGMSGVCVGVARRPGSEGSVMEANREDSTVTP